MSHLSAVGHPVSNKDEFRKLAYQAYKQGRSVKTSSGEYVAWSPSPGVQIWVELNNERAIVGCNPHFSGLGHVKMSIIEHYTGYGTDLEGRVYGWVEPIPNCLDIGLYPIVLDIPDWDLVKDSLQVGTVAEIQVSAFAHDLYCYDNDLEFDQKQEHDLKWSPESFLFMGMFEADGTASTPPRPEAVFAGHVEKAEFRTNKATKNPYYYLVVKTLGGTYDVVADPKIVNGKPVVGGVVQGSFWLSGRVDDDYGQSYVDRPEPLLARFFKRKNN